MASLGSSELIAFISTTDLGRARVFYEHVLGLRVVVQNDFACVFDVGGMMLRVTAVDAVACPGYTVLGWRVADIDEAVPVLSDYGATFTNYDGMADQDPRGIWTTPGGDRVAWFADPDGNNLSLTQFA